MRNKSGFTILEVLIVMMIAGVMMGLGYNYIMGWLPNYRLRNAARDVYSNLQLAKMAAIKEHQACTVTFTTNTAGIIDGYVIYFDLNDDSQYKKSDDGDPLRRVSLEDDYKNDVEFDSNKSGDGVTFLMNNSVTFKTNGLIDTSATGNSPKNVFLKNSTGRKWRVEVNPVGRIKIEFDYPD